MAPIILPGLLTTRFIRVRSGGHAIGTRLVQPAGVSGISSEGIFGTRNVGLAEPTVPLGRHDRGVAEDFLQGGWGASRFQPAAGERVPELVIMEVRDPRFPPDDLDQ